MVVKYIMLIHLEGFSGLYKNNLHCTMNILQSLFSHLIEILRYRLEILEICVFCVI